MSIHDAEPGDIYVDSLGKLWRVMAICHEPTVTVEEVEGHIPTSPAFSGVAQAVVAAGGWQPPTPQIVKARQSGSVSGLMWQGFKRIWRKEAQ